MKEHICHGNYCGHLQVLQFRIPTSYNRHSPVMDRQREWIPSVQSGILFHEGSIAMAGRATLFCAACGENTEHMAMIERMEPIAGPQDHPRTTYRCLECGEATATIHFPAARVVSHSQLTAQTK
jgi:hypothetical protein